jgi:3-deoxy-7-phosphoheptulonate synthase
MNQNQNQNPQNSTATEKETHDWHIMSITPLPTPGELRQEFPLSQDVFNRVVNNARLSIQKILSGEDKRVLAIVGPCSIHRIDEALEYAKRLAPLSQKYSDRMCIIMRCCLDKPRTSRGWPGFCQDPDMNGSYNFQDGWRRGRELLVKILELGLPIGLEFLDADTCQNVDDCVSYFWLGARTISSPRLRQTASGLSAPVGFKNPTEGNVNIAIDAIDFARHPSAFVASNHKGRRCEYRTTGHPWGHVILRGTNKGPNFGPEHVNDAVHKLAARGLLTKVVIDASHGNSNKDHSKQKDVIRDVAKRMAAGDHMAGFMYESYIGAGSQKLPKDLSDLKDNVSVTDGCDDFETTASVLEEVYQILAPRFAEASDESPTEIESAARDTVLANA